MPEILEKLRPDRDLQCYFERPSAVAALSESGPSGFTISGTWRQQFDWAVLEWHRDNVFEHPAFRYLPDGDLSGLVLTYEESRENCIPLDSTLYPTVDWPFLRVWMETGGAERFYQVPLKPHATPVEGVYRPAGATFTLRLTGQPGSDNYAELAWTGEHHTYKLAPGDSEETAAQALASIITANSRTMMASSEGNRITLTYLGVDQTPETSREGLNGNRVGVYGNVKGPGHWEPWWQQLSGGESPAKWRVELDFSNLIVDENGSPVPMTHVRRMRWTYAADLQPGEFRRSEFRVRVSNWTVAGANRRYRVAGPGSRRVEDDSPELFFSGSGWSSPLSGNFSGGSLRHTRTPQDGVSLSYTHPVSHTLYMGTRKASSGSLVSICVDGVALRTEDLHLAGEDILVRVPVAELAGGVPHSVTVSHAGPADQYFYFDFFEMAVPAGELPVFPRDARTTLATDWDTDHSIVLAPERTAWFLDSLGFTGRANHYAGALWFYELMRAGHRYAAGTVEFTGSPAFGMGEVTELSIQILGRNDPPTVIQHLHLIGDTADSIAKAFELEINSGYTAIWAAASENRLTIQARAMGSEGNTIRISARVTSPSNSGFQAIASQDALTGGVDGEWRTDLDATPRLNRAVRDWSSSYFRALKAHGIEAAAAFSMELQHGDPSPEAGIAQRFADGTPCLLNTPALQTNFSPASRDYWKQVHAEMAAIMSGAGQVPYLQFGEVQWWYFPWRWDAGLPSPAWVDAASMPYYDAYTQTAFQQRYGRTMHVFLSNQEAPASYPEECEFLSSLIGQFTTDVMDFVRQSHPHARFEVLYPTDVNEPPLNQAVNLPAAWSGATLDCLKTENFSFTGARDLDKARRSMTMPVELGFPPGKHSHLVGIGDYTTPWEKESRIAAGEGVESIVLFAIDQFCLIGYRLPLKPGARRSWRKA